jgi:DNA (cytosine-5)-methyltransferase 1
MKKFNFIDLFAGIGGFRQGLESVGGQCVFSSEIDKYCQETYFENYGEIPSGDITKINEDSIPDHDVLCAGFPCQPFSISGKQLGFNDTRGTLFFDIIRIIKKKKPKVVFLENVANLARHDQSKTVNQMIELLVLLGYKVKTKIINASDFNVPQARKRLYFVCFLDAKNDFEFPIENNENFTVVNDILEENVHNIFTIPFSISKIDKKLETQRCKSIVRIGSIGKGGQGNRIYSPFGQAITLSANGGGKAAKTGAYLIKGNIRKLTPRECARLLGFNDSFKIHKNKNQAYKQFGNSVAVPVIKAIAKEIIKYL